MASVLNPRATLDYIYPGRCSDRTEGKLLLYEIGLAAELNVEVLKKNLFCKVITFG